jgi:hypothetical protein
MPDEKPKPKGSGIFAVVFGLLALLASFQHGLTKIPPDLLVKAWLLFVAAILIGWGANRIRVGSKNLTVGQDTINFVVAIMGATFALLALFNRP